MLLDCFSGWSFRKQVSESAQSININNHNESPVTFFVCYWVLFLVLIGLRDSTSLFICIKLHVS